MRASQVKVRDATPDDAGFIREMARHASTLEDRPLPPPDAEDVTELLPAAYTCAVIGTDSGEPIGAAWWRAGEAALVPGLADAPELAMAMVPEARRQGAGTAVLQALLKKANAEGHPVLVLNVHLRNTSALHLYMKCGFRVAAAGRGWFGVAMASGSGET